MKMTDDMSFHVVRVLACVMVVGMHAPLSATDAANGVLLSALSYFTAPCIGLFFMLSGALLLPVRTGTASFLRKRFGKVVCPTVFWSLFYIACAAYTDWSLSAVWKSVISIPFSAQGSPVLWFMYTLMGLYLLAPVLSRWLCCAGRKEVEFYLALWGVTLCYPVLSVFVDCNTGDTGILYYFTGYSGYFLLGYYLRAYPDRWSLKLIIPAMLVCVAIPVLCKMGRVEVDFYSIFWYLSVFVAIQCVFWFRLVAWVMARVRLTGFVSRGIIVLSRLSLGIYMIHIFIMRYLLWHWDVIRNMDSYVMQTVVIAVMTFVLSAIVAWLIGLLPNGGFLVGVKRVSH